MIPGHVISVPLLAIFALVPLLCSSATASSSNAAKMDRSSPPDEQLSERGKYGYISAGYFPNYAIYARNFQPTNIVSKTLTHILYAFADTDPIYGNVTLTDLFADQQKHYPGDLEAAPGNNLYGNFKQLYLLKQAKRNLKVLLSIGGFTYSQAGHFNFTSNPTARATFVATAIQTLEDNGLDGIDIDFEYPLASQKADLACLVRELRRGLDWHARKKGDVVPYQLSLAVPAGAKNYVNFDVAAMDPFITNWNLMAYDYAGPWSNVSDYMDNLYRGKTKQGVDTDSVLKWYTENGATRRKINMGIPLYGRVFENTTGIQQPYSGVGSGGWGDGVWDVKVLPLAGANITEDFKTGGSYSYDAAKKELITFDTANIVKEKARYVVHHRFGGNSYWDISSDYVGSGSLISTAVDQYSGLDQTSNHLYYPGSRFDNMRSCMGACSPPNYTTTSAATTTTPTSPLSVRIPRKNFHARGRGALYPKGRRGHVWYVSNVTIPRHPDHLE